MFSHIKEARLFTISVVGLALLLLLPYLWLGTDAFVLVGENLDSEFIYCHLLKVTGLLFGFDGSTPVPNVMNGLPRSSFHSEFSFIRLLFYILPSFWAYVVNGLLVRVIGFTGMYLLCRDYLLKGVRPRWGLALAVLFALIPLYTMYGLSVMGQPLLVWAFLNIAQGRKKWTDILIVLFFPFYAHFAMLGPFIAFALGVYGLSRWGIRIKARAGYRYWGALCALVLCFVLANSVVFSSFLLPGGFVSHRTEWAVEALSFRQMAVRFMWTFVSGQYHSSSFIAIPTYVFGLYALFVVRKDRRKMLYMALPMLLVAGIALFDAVYPSIAYAVQQQFHKPLLFQFNRFTFLIPFLWFITLGLAIRFTWQKVSPVLPLLFLVAQFLPLAWRNHELRDNYAKLVLGRNNTPHAPGFQSFFAPQLFDEVAAYINRPKNEYRVLSVGIYPSVAQYNGFYTLDSYQNNYPLPYKHAFRSIIQGELDKNAGLKTYFDDWGSKCYVFSAELYAGCRDNCVKTRSAHIEQLNIDTQAARALGAEYLFSAVPITGYASTRFLKKISHPNAVWDIYLYRL